MFQNCAIVYSYSDATHICVPKNNFWTGMSHVILTYQRSHDNKSGHIQFTSQTHESNLKSTFTTHWYAGGQSLVWGECIGVALFVNILQGCVGKGWGRGGGNLGDRSLPRLWAHVTICTSSYRKRTSKIYYRKAREERTTFRLLAVLQKPKLTSVQIYSHNPSQYWHFGSTSHLCHVQ